MQSSLRVLVIAFDETALHRVLQVLEEANSLPDLSINWTTATGLQDATAILETQQFDCLVLTGNAMAPALQLLREFQAYTINAPIVLVLDQADAEMTQYWLETGIGEALSCDDLTPRLLAQTLRWLIRVNRSEQQVAYLERHLQRSDQILQRQAKTLDAQAQQIQQLNRQLAGAAQLKSQFLATVSHELRTPMNAVIGFSQLLLRHNQKPLESQQRTMVERILSNAQHLLQIINEMLNFAKLEAGQLQLQPQPLNFTHLIHAVGQELEEVARRKQLWLEIFADLQDPYVVNDPTWLQQVVFQLVSNALKFTPSGGVRITLQESENWITLVVQDTGIGIQLAELDHIFEPFRQIDQTTTRQHRGLGMGLALTAALVRKMGGTITVDSTVGQGSTFRVELPRHREMEMEHKLEGSVEDDNSAEYAYTLNKVAHPVR